MGMFFTVQRYQKKIGPGLAPLLIFVGVMGHRWYLCGSGCCISPGVNIKNIWNHLATKRSPFFQKKRPNSFECFCWREAKKGWPQEKRRKFAKMVHSCWGKRVPGKNWNNHDSIRNISSVAIISTFQKAIWKRSHRDFGSSKKVSQKNNKKSHPSSLFFISHFKGVSPFVKDLGTSPGWEANMAKPSGSTGPGKLDPKMGGELDLMIFGCTKGS